IDKEAAQTWIYPVNYPIRQYQLQIVTQALFKNTLVALPTGLGKTLIAAVVMYNYYRWFPEGKVVFLAPTKPLVAQQISACYDIMGVPEQDTAELQGSVDPKKRAQLWDERRVFFCTPQSMANDIKHKRCDPARFVCVVNTRFQKFCLDPLLTANVPPTAGTVLPAKIKSLRSSASPLGIVKTPCALETPAVSIEKTVGRFALCPTQAHRGTGNYAYVNVVREVAAATSHFRVLALSATPGSDIKVRLSSLLLLRL
ncbi:unnamed protein product, partial [Ectocarpus sp. 13 AM-2016]